MYLEKSSSQASKRAKSGSLLERRKGRTYRIKRERRETVCKHVDREIPIPIYLNRNSSPRFRPATPKRNISFHNNSNPPGRPRKGAKKIVNLLNILLCRLKQRKLILAKHTREADIDFRECKTKLPHVSLISAVSVQEGMIGRNEKRWRKRDRGRGRAKRTYYCPKQALLPRPKG